MATVEIQLFGQVAISDGDGRQLVITPPRAQELFCYLVLNRSRALTREALLDTFWQHSSAAQARRNLRQTLWQLQAALAAWRQPAPEPLICASPLWVALNPDAAVSSDVTAFARAFEPVKDMPGEQLDERLAEQLRGAVALYRGDLMEGWYCEWCLIDRERFQLMYLAMLDKLMGYCEGRRLFEQGLGYGERALRCESTNERIHRRLMRLHHLSGNHTGALQQYRRCVHVLRDELGVDPSARTTRLLRQLQQGPEDGGLAGDAPRGEGAEQQTTGHMLADMRERLGQLADAVSAIQARLQEELLTVERAIGELRQR